MTSCSYLIPQREFHRAPHHIHPVPGLRGLPIYATSARPSGIGGTASETVFRPGHRILVALGRTRLRRLRRRRAAPQRRRDPLSPGRARPPRLPLRLRLHLQGRPLVGRRSVDVRRRRRHWHLWYAGNMIMLRNGGSRAVAVAPTVSML